MSHKHVLENFRHHYPFITEGFVMDNEDPDQMGRLKVWIPAIDGEHYVIEHLPWTEYATPFGGVTFDFPAGVSGAVSPGPVGYGFWAIPKINAQVLCFFLNGDHNRRFYFSSYFDTHRNRSLPGGRNQTDSRQPGPWTDTYDPLEPAHSNLKQAFSDQTGSPIAQTRGVNERQVAQAADIKDGSEGYANSAADGKYLDPQTYCMVTPGHHYITMCDAPDNCRIRIKSTEGNQIILDDTNERIYISTAKGNSWVEIDQDGHISIYSAASVSVQADEDINLSAGRNVNIESQGGINIKSVGDTKITGGNVHAVANAQMAVSGCKVDINSTDTKIGGDQINVKSKGTISMQGQNLEVKGDAGAKLSGGKVDINSGGVLALSGSPVTANSHTGPGDGDMDQVVFPGGDAAKAGDAVDPVCATPATGPSIIPGHEPWIRPANTTRNKYFKG